MPVIYEPRGKAREYSELACNLYTGCIHKCKYCYCPAIMRKSLDEWSNNPHARTRILKQLENEHGHIRHQAVHTADYLIMAFHEMRPYGKPLTEKIKKRNEKRRQMFTDFIKSLFGLADKYSHQAKNRKYVDDMKRGHGIHVYVDGNQKFYPVIKYHVLNQPVNDNLEPFIFIPQ